MTATDFNKGDTVYGVKAGKFVVTGVRKVGGGLITIIDVREVGPNGQLGRECGMTPECFQTAPR